MSTDKNPLTTQIDFGGIWHIGIYVGVAACVLYLIFLNWQTMKIGIAASLLWAYTLLYALYTIEYPAMPYGIYNTAFQVTAGQVFIEALMIPLTVILLKPHFKWVWKLVSLVVLAEIVCVWTGEGKGLMAWSSFDTAFIALCVPFVPWQLNVFSIFTIVTHHGSTALMILFVQFLAVCIHYKWFRKFLLLLIPAALFVAYKHQLNPWFDSGERLRTYKHFMIDFWYNKGHIKRYFIGTGFGSFIWVSLLLDKYTPPIFLHLHSDWLQIIFEGGMACFVLTLSLITDVLILVRKNTRLLAGVFGVCAFGLTYHPLRFFPSAFVSALIIYECLSLREFKRSENVFSKFTVCLHRLYCKLPIKQRAFIAKGCTMCGRVFKLFH